MVQLASTVNTISTNASAIHVAMVQSAKMASMSTDVNVNLGTLGDFVKLISMTAYLTPVQMAVFV